MNAVVKLTKIYLLRLIIYLLHILPIKKGRIIFNSYKGGQYSCNPKYLSEFLEENGNGAVEIIWAFNAPEKYFYLKNRNIKLVKYSSLKRFYYEATAQVSINNVGSYSWIPIRKGQEHINTWHAGGSYKKTGLDENKNSSLMKKTIKMTADETSLFLSSSKYFSTVSIPHNLGYQGEILECGLPRNDFLVTGNRPDIVDKVYAYYGVEKNKFILLYAPTWRYNNWEIPPLDFTGIKNAVRTRFNQECVILYRAHHINGGAVQEEIISATEYPDMQELLLTADMLITDYSSCIWDYSFTYRPCFLYTPDLEEYRRTRGFNRDIVEWHFPICESNIILQKKIIEFSQEKHTKAMKKHQDELGSYESGKACEDVCRKILEYCNK